MYAYTLGPALGGLLAGLFHMIHRKAHRPVDHHTHSSVDIDHLAPNDFDSNEKEEKNLLAY